MKKLLVTGGTVFVSKYVADYFKEKYEVYVLNRDTKPQLGGVHLIKADRHHLGDILKSYQFDAVIDVCAYTASDIVQLLSAIQDVEDYIFISSSAVYPDTNPQPFTEEQALGSNRFWGKYGTDKVEAEQALLSKKSNAYILRPPYLYGPMQNIYREPFVFECALKERKFYIPESGNMQLQFFHIEDLCKIIEIILRHHPSHHILNVGNAETVSVNTFVDLCYKAANKRLIPVHVYHHPNPRDYFCFASYEYKLDVAKQKALLPHTKDLAQGLKESFAWYSEHLDSVIRKNYIEFIDQYL